MNHKSLDENLGKLLKAERAHRISTVIKLIVVASVAVAAIAIVVFQ